MSHRLPSYKKSSCCQSDCHWDSEEAPCWGKVEVVDELQLEDDSWWIHACQGHCNFATQEGEYVKSNLPEDNSPT